MKVYVNVKEAASRKNYIKKEEVVLKNKPSTLRELINEIVTDSVEKFNDDIKKEKLVDYLTINDIDSSAKLGKVSFGTKYNDNVQDLEKALKTAYLAYEDGIYKVFIGDNEAEALDSSIYINEGDSLTFIKFTMLSGRLW